MTYCSPLAEPLQKYIEEGKTLDEIGMKMCGNSVKNPRRKAIRLICILLSKNTLTEFKDTLKYQESKVRADNSFLRRKNYAEVDNDVFGVPGNCPNKGMQSSTTSGEMECSESDTEPKHVVEAIRLIISRFGFDRVKQAWETIISEISPVEETNPVKNYESNVSEEVATTS